MPVGRRRELLLEAGARVIARSGVSAATTRAIVAEAGMPLASFHYAFASHQEFLLRLVERQLVPDPPPEPTAEPFPVALEEFIRGLVSLDAASEGVIAELALHGMQHKALREEITRRVRMYDDQLIESLEKLAASHGMEWTVPPTRLAPLINSWRFGAMIELSYARHGSPYENEDPTAALIDVLACVARPIH